MANKKPARKTTPTKTGEFHFEQECSNSGKLTYRCMELIVSADMEADEFSAADLAFIEQIVNTLNEHFVSE